jgi:hypothetical protein
MKLPIPPCEECLREIVEPPPSSIVTVEFRDDGRYEVTCPKGHSSVTVLHQQKFEILFEIGAYAIRDRYYREAVSSFTASLERFYEFFVRAALFEKGLDADTIATSWNAVARQSERQLGAFIFVYTDELRRTPPLLTNKRTAFRNEVIHRGRIPTRQEAVDYGQAVLDVMLPVLREAKEQFRIGVLKTIQEHLKHCQAQEDEGTNVITMDLLTIVSLSVDGSVRSAGNLEEALKNLVRWP